MKKILILMIFTIMFVACSDNGVSSDSTTQPPDQQPTYSSASTYIPPVNTQPYISSNSSEKTSYWSLEIGNVCNDYNIDVAINDKSIICSRLNT